MVIISDTHCGCQLGLCPPEGARRDEGGTYQPSPLQLKLWTHWRTFWDQWVPIVTKGEPWGLVINGDAIDGVHHSATHQISHNLAIQGEIAEVVLFPVVARAAWYRHIRGTEAHVGKSGAEEERLAKVLGAMPNEHGQYARYDLWLRLGGHLVHILHHIGTTGSQAYEATAVHKELTESLIEAARWGHEPPAVVVRSHRHRNVDVSLPTQHGRSFVIVTPGWQLKTPFAWKAAGSRLSVPQIGGTVIRIGDDGQIYPLHYVYTMPRSEVEDA